MPENTLLNTTELQKLVEEYQSGEQEQTQEVPKIKSSAASKSPNGVERLGFGSELNDIMFNDAPRTAAHTYTQEAAEAGYGQSRHDIAPYTPDTDLENARALEQSGMNKVLAGAAKLVTTAGTTFVNTTAGLISGMLSGGVEAGKQLFNEEKAFSPIGILEAGVNNPVSKEMIDWQNYLETAIPNYRIEAERTEQYQRQWIKHVFTPNFIGDSLLKNFGFTLGAMGGGMLIGKGINSLSQKALASNIMKGSVIASTGDAEADAAFERAIQALKRGTATSV